MALNTGFRRARQLDPDVVVTIDADGQHLPEEMAFVMAPVLEGKADMAVGSRYLREALNVPRHRVWGHHIFNSIAHHLSGISTTDSQSGFRAFSPRALSALTFSSKGFSVESEMQLLAREHHLRMKDVSTTIQYLDRPKRSVLAHGLMVLSGVLRLTGQYRPLLFFGAPGIVFLLAGLALGTWVIDTYRTYRLLPVEYAFLRGLLTTLAALSTFTGIILHSIRGLLLNLPHPRD